MKFSMSQLLLVGFAIVAAFFYFKNKGPSSEEIKELSLSNDSIWIDVREKSEVTDGTLASAYWIPLSLIQSGGPQLQSHLDKLDKNKNWLLFCRSGNRSGIAKGVLDGMGYKTKNVGGFSSLAQQGMKTVQPSNPMVGEQQN